jgi:hypothetical protein
MMQSCASAAKLRGGGPILNRGSKTIVRYRVAATSDRHRPVRVNRIPTGRSSVRRACELPVRPSNEGADLRAPPPWLPGARAQ